MLPDMQLLVEDTIYVSQCGIQMSGGDAYWRVVLWQAPDLTLLSCKPRGAPAYPQKILSADISTPKDGKSDQRKLPGGFEKPAWSVFCLFDMYLILNGVLTAAFKCIVGYQNRVRIKTGFESHKYVSQRSIQQYMEKSIQGGMDTDIPK